MRAESDRLHAETRAVIAERERYIGIKEACRILGVSRSTIDRLRKRRPSGFPTEYRPWGSSPRFRKADLQDWVEAQPLW